MIVRTQQLTSTATPSVNTSLKATFASRSIPATLMTDNGPQYSSHQMQEFANAYGFAHITGSTQYPRSNGHA